MPVVPFIADSPADALARIRAELGEDAVVVNVRKLPPDGLKRLWTKPRIEVVAWAPDAKEPVAGDLAALREELAQVREQLQHIRVETAAPQAHTVIETTPAEPVIPAQPPGTWRTGAILESIGVLPVNAERVQKTLISRHGERAPENLAAELRLARAVLAGFWRQIPSQLSDASRAALHVFIGAPGTGKTTCLCKWLTQHVLLEGRPARIWRLDGRAANAAEWLSVHCEILSVPVERSLPTETGATGAETIFVDLPGVPWNDAAAVEDLAQQVKSLGGAQVHLVLNAAYETSLLLAQARAFASLPVTDLIVTHLDEDPHWGKLWNLVLGTNYSLRFMAGGQNIPGDFHAASVERLLARQFLHK